MTWMRSNPNAANEWQDVRQGTGRLWLRMMGTSVGYWGSVAVVTLIIFAVQPSLAIDAYARMWELFGYGLAPVALLVLGVLRTWPWRNGLLLRRWRVFAGTALCVLGGMGGLAFFNGPSGTMMADTTLGGEVGLRIQGGLAWAGVLRVVFLSLLGIWTLSPKRFQRCVRLIFRWGVRFAWWTRRPLRLLVNVVVVPVSLYGIYLVRRGFVLIAMVSFRCVVFAVNQAVAIVRTLLILIHRMYIAAVPSSTAVVHGTYHPRNGLHDRTPKENGSSKADGFPVSTNDTDVVRQIPLPEATEEEQSQEMPVAPPLVVGNDWSLPPITLLEPGKIIQVSEAENADVARHIEATLRQYGVEVHVEQIRPGPTVTMFGLVPGWVRRYREVRKRDGDGNVVRDAYGKPVSSRVEERTRVKIDSILAREKDLALALAARSVRIEAPVPGESVVGLEVPNSKPSLVTLRAGMESNLFNDILEADGLPIGLGQGAGGDAVAVDLLNMPHLLIAGATGSGKSVCMNSIIASLVMHWSPLKLRLLLIDPKRVELTPYNGIPHLASPVLVETDQVVRTLKGVVREMFRRFRALESAGVRNIQSYNATSGQATTMPYLVVCIDELADLMMSATYDVEHTLCRLAQLGRATGIHLIVATQRPSVDVITGLIKANFPSRISFAVASQIDSRTILDSSGAERLLGRGDMLFQSPDAPKPKRIQGAFVGDREIESLVAYWRDQEGPQVPEMSLEELGQESEEENAEGRVNQRDELMGRAIDLASRYNRLSTSLLQRRLQIGYPRAAKLMDWLEEEGIVGPSALGGRPREVIHRPGRHTSDEE